MKITVHGAGGGEVTGSAYLVETTRATVLVDAGFFQGSDEAEARNVLPPEWDPNEIDAVLLTHAHLDHTGRLPLLLKGGYRGPVFATAATFELTDILLKDSAKLQAQDTQRINRKRERAGEPPVEPLFGPEHLEPLGELARAIELKAPVPVAEGIVARYLEAGHILGSTSVELVIDEGLSPKKILFSGDLGPTTLPILREFQPPAGADVVFLESTYGDRDHRSYSATISEFEGIVAQVALKRGKMLVPVFAIGRAQQILYHFAEMFRKGVVRTFPVYLDSPMAIDATRVYLRHRDLFDREAQSWMQGGAHPLGAGHFRTSVSADDSRQLNDLEGPCAILAGSGMCTGGRIVHHLKQNLWKADTHVLIVGYQAHGSLGRQLVERAAAVTIHGERVAVKAQVHTLGGFSAHAGQSELLEWFSGIASSRPRVVLVHGEDGPRAALAARIHERFALGATLPLLGQVIEV
jgi:metallo-beta-lactamase family protein